MTTKRNRISTRQRIDCGKVGVEALRKSYADYEKSKTFPNNFKRIK